VELQRKIRGVQGAQSTYGPSVQVKTREKPQERTWASDSSREGRFGVMAGYVGLVCLQKPSILCGKIHKKVT